MESEFKGLPVQNYNLLLITSYFCYYYVRMLIYK